MLVRVPQNREKLALYFPFSFRTPLKGFGPSLPSMNRPVSVSRLVKPSVNGFGSWVRLRTSPLRKPSPVFLAMSASPPASGTGAVWQDKSIERMFVCTSIGASDHPVGTRNRSDRG